MEGLLSTVFDEPEAGIDLWSFQNLIRIFEAMRKNIQDSSMIIISHQERILNIADEIAVLANGRIEQFGTRDEMLPKLIGTFQTAVLCGITLATACFIKIVLIDRLLLGNTEVTILVAAVVCATMALTVLVAKVIGCTLPMVANRLGFDPAVMSSPFITTIVDALSLLVYFTIASALLFR